MIFSFQYKKSKPLHIKKPNIKFENLIFGSPISKNLISAI